MNNGDFSKLMLHQFQYYVLKYAFSWWQVLLTGLCLQVKTEGEEP